MCVCVCVCDSVCFRQQASFQPILSARGHGSVDLHGPTKLGIRQGSPVPVICDFTHRHCCMAVVVCTRYTLFSYLVQSQIMLQFPARCSIRQSYLAASGMLHPKVALSDSIHACNVGWLPSGNYACVSVCCPNLLRARCTRILLPARTSGPYHWNLHVRHS